MVFRRCGVRFGMSAAFVRLLACAAWLLLPGGSLHAQAPGSPSALPPELEKVKSALEKYQDPIVAVHDGYFSTLGCVEFPAPGAPGEVPYAAGGMGVHFFNVTLMGPEVDPLRPQVLVY